MLAGNIRCVNIILARTRGGDRKHEQTGWSRNDVLLAECARTGLLPDIWRIGIVMMAYIAQDEALSHAYLFIVHVRRAPVLVAHVLLDSSSALSITEVI